MYKKGDEKGTDNKIKYVCAKDFLKLKFLGKWFFLLFLWRAASDRNTQTEVEKKMFLGNLIWEIQSHSKSNPFIQTKYKNNN